jgi:hypothetical protein
MSQLKTPLSLFGGITGSSVQFLAEMLKEEYRSTSYYARGKDLNILLTYFELAYSNTKDNCKLKDGLQNQEC